MNLSELAVDMAALAVGVREERPNSGPEIDEWLRMVGQPPGQPWCAAFVYAVFAKAAGKLGLTNPVPRTASSQRMWRWAEPICRESNPKAGYVYVLKHSDDTGHVGLVEEVDDLGVITEISGNTFTRGGGRAGNSVARHRGQPEVTHGGELLGYLDFDRAAQAPPGLS